MTLACQRDSYLKELETKVVSCTPLSGSNYKYVVTLEDTILFPEGGGQPNDFGTINGISVDSVKRKGNLVLHYVQEPLVDGETVTVVVDWKRRFDHMQQHTAQHLITAVAESMFHYRTTSWCLGEDLSYVELDVPSMTKEEVFDLEEVLNEKIRASLPVTAHIYEKDSLELVEVRTRIKLPEDHLGPVRVINIDDVDSNTCCGTHVKNTSELQAIKLLYSDKGKRKNKTSLFYVSGNRVLKELEGSFSLEQSLVSRLNCNPADMVETVEKLQHSLKAANKNFLYTLRDLATLEARLFNLKQPKPRFYFLHRKNAEPEFMTIFLSEVNDDSVLFFLTVGDGANGGQLILAGPENLVQQYGSRICGILGGKGCLKKGKYHGKFNKTSNIQRVVDILKSAVET